MKRMLSSPRPFTHLAALLSGLALAACSAPPASESTSGAVELRILAMSSDITAATVTVSGLALAVPRVSSLFARGGEWGGLLGGLPAATGYTFTVNARDVGGTVIYTGATANVTVVRGQTVTVLITAQQVTPPAPYGNAIPIVDALIISSTNVAPSDPVSVQVTAHDPNPQDTITLQWQSTCGSFADAAAANTTWTAPASAASCSISIKVSDQRGGTVAATVTVNVAGANGKGQAQVSVGTNNWPVVTNVAAAPNGYLAVGTPTTLTVTASDADKDPLTYAWDSTCTGLFSTTAGASPIFVLASGQTATTCTFNVVVSDGRGGSTTGSVVLPVGNPSFNQAPVIVETVQSAATAISGDRVVLVVDATDPEGGALTFQWAANAGGFSGEQDTATSSRVLWTAPDTTTGDWRATVTVTDPLGATSTQVFTIAPAGPAIFQFVYTSDAHYGITRVTFRGDSAVSGQIVNTAMVAEINSLPSTILPTDNGVRAGLPVGSLDMVIETGDIANRQESAAPAIQSAALSWGQFRTDYILGLSVLDQNGVKAPLWLLPGNHDVSNAIGYYKAMLPLKDATSMAEIYNYMFSPAVPLTAASYDYSTQKIHYSKDVGGIHMAFLNMWPDTGERAWLEADLAQVNARTPVMIFVHDQPDCESKHFTNPNGTHTINSTDKFENLLVDQLADVDSAGKITINNPSTIEQRALVTFLKAHRNVLAYFHGNSNWNQYYDWTGPDGDIALHTIRVDSPMKGSYSATDETLLSFQVVSVDTRAKQMSVRECLWNKTPTAPAPMPVVWGASETLSLVPPL